MPSLPPASQEPLSPPNPQGTSVQSLNLSTEDIEAIKRGEAFVIDIDLPPALSPEERANAIEDAKKVIRENEKLLKDKGGRPCELCDNKDTILLETQNYLDTGDSGKTAKPRMLFLNELALKLGHHRDTLADWRNKRTEDGEPEHPEFIRMIKVLETNQELRLQQGLMGRYNPTGKIFLLKTKFGYMESEKKILAGDRNEPLQIEIIEEGVRHVAED